MDFNDNMAEYKRQMTYFIHQSVVYITLETHVESTLFLKETSRTDLITEHIWTFERPPLFPGACMYGLL